MTLGSDWGQVQPGDRGMRPWRCVVLSAFDLVRGQFEDGAGGETRTPNRLFTRQERYRLRHASMVLVSPSQRLDGGRPSGNDQAVTLSGCVHRVQSG